MSICASVDVISTSWSGTAPRLRLLLTLHISSSETSLARWNSCGIELHMGKPAGWLADCMMKWSMEDWPNREEKAAGE